MRILLHLLFSILYYFIPDCRCRHVQEQSQARFDVRNDDQRARRAQSPGDDPEGDGSGRVRLREGVRRVRRGNGTGKEERRQKW